MSSFSFPRMLLVRQNFADRRIPDVADEVRRQLAVSPFASQLRPGARVAIGVGSRGINDIAIIVRAAVDYWKQNGMQPFIIPAMGSHGAATAEGQADVLAHYGVDEQNMGCPVVSQLEVVSLGKTQDNIEAFMDRAAYGADGVMLINRTKWHTDFSGKIESGLFKMMAIGLGKFAGARRYHMYGYKLGLEHVIRSVGRLVLKSGKIVGGLAILEDAYHHTAKLDAVTAGNMEQREEENLALARSWMATIPIDLDVLVIDEIGKQISGGGMDWKVVNRGFEAERNPYSYVHRFERIFIRDLSPLSYGNSIGMGLAEIVTDRLVNKTNWQATYINGLTSLGLASIRTPIHLPTDRECLKAIMPTVGKFEMSDVTVGWIRNTLELGTIALSENLKPEIAKNPMLEILGAARAMEFDGAGNLLDILRGHPQVVPA
jgi:hypothetical protein